MMNSQSEGQKGNNTNKRRKITTMGNQHIVSFLLDNKIKQSRHRKMIALPLPGLLAIEMN